MIEVKENVDLFPFNTFHIHAVCRYLVTIRTEEEAREIFEDSLFRSHRHLILGGGSNILMTGDFDGVVVKNELSGITAQHEDDDTISLTVASGENWHRLVLYCVERDFGGIENLSLIPGTVGAAPMQNIGAYGVEIREVIRSVRAIELKTGASRVFDREECAFGYRESIFKQELRDQYFISSVTLSLTKRNHRFNVSYGAIQDVLRKKNIEDLSIRAISDAVIEIRSSKLPDPSVIGNAGSFFKNPSVDSDFFERLKKEYPAIPSFPGENSLVKLPAAWLIEQCGWKGRTLGTIGVHKHQALVLVNYGDGEGQKIWQLARDIQSSVREKFDIVLQPEVNVF
ncbi:MAG: UDP-N-acetylmuramate dehydrogenase [Bacteroidota bacterium]|nr:UDP-N-acetylmuramate dehydrogenase [Bacteroidota bacterium]